MVELTNPFHVGVVVADVEEAMARISEGTGLAWHSVQSVDLNLLVEGEVVPAGVRFTYSVDGPLQIELASGPPGSFWDVDLYGGLNHLGYWTENLHDDVAALRATGCELIFGGAGTETMLKGEATLEGFAFLMSPIGQRIELIDVAMRPAFDRWFAGGVFG